MQHGDIHWCKNIYHSYSINVLCIRTQENIINTLYMPTTRCMIDNSEFDMDGRRKTRVVRTVAGLRGSADSPPATPAYIDNLFC